MPDQSRDTPPASPIMGLSNRRNAVRHPEYRHSGNWAEVGDPLYGGEFLKQSITYGPPLPEPPDPCATLEPK